MSDWHWVRTHQLSGFSDNAGHVTISDVLECYQHNIHVFADAAHQRPVNVRGMHISNNGQQIRATRK